MYYNIYIPCAISNALYPAQTSDIHVDPVNIQKECFFNYSVEEYLMKLLFA